MLATNRDVIAEIIESVAVGLHVARRGDASTMLTGAQTLRWVDENYEPCSYDVAINEALGHVLGPVMDALDEIETAIADWQEGGHARPAQFRAKIAEMVDRAQEFVG